MKRLALQVKVIGSPPTASTAPSGNPAMAQRPAGIEIDEGRPWSGDVFEEGITTDPAEAFARFVSENDTEAWLDRNEDGTLIGWVREGGDVWRYADVDAWALDVDGAQMQRDDSGTVDTGEFDPGADPEDEDPEAFEDEFDPATDEADPTEAVEDPTDLPDDEVEDDLTNPFADDDEDNPAAQDAADPDTPVTAERAEDEIEDGADDDPDEDEDPDEGEDPEGDPADEPEDTEDEGDPAEDGDGQGDEDGDPADDEDDVTEEDQLFRRTQKKHMTGEHNQDTHGNWTAGIAAGARRASDAAGGGESRPKGPAPEKATVSEATIGQMSDDELNSLLESDDLYEYEAMERAAKELDRREDVDAPMREFLGENPTPSAKAGAFDSVIPDEWSQWVATGSRAKRKRSKEREAREAYEAFVQAQHFAAMEATEGYFYNNKASKVGARPFDELAFFDGRASRQQVRKYASEELLRFFGDNPRMTFAEFAADELGWVSFKKAKDRLQSDYLSEFG